MKRAADGSVAAAPPATRSLALTVRDAALVRASFAALIPHKAAVAARFYERLFQIDPKLRVLFRGDMEAQGRKLMDTLSVLVMNLRDLNSITPTLERLGQRHVGYGTRDEDYDTVGRALLWTLERSLGDAFTPETRAAWTGLYRTVADTMRRAARAAA